MGNQGGKALKWLPAHFNFERKIRLLFCECGYPFGTLCLIVRRGTEVPYTPCLLIRPVLRLRLHVTQSQPCFPAAPNAIAFPGGNPIFAATLTERITHYTLQAKSCAKGQAPLETPTNNKKAEYPALSLCRIFNLYLLSAAPFHGLPFVSLSIMFPCTGRLQGSSARNVTGLLQPQGLSPCCAPFPSFH